MTNYLSTSVLIEIPFHDIDAAHIVWHGHYAKYFEIARSALFKLFDFDFSDMLQTPYLWPIVELNCRYMRPLRYGMLVKSHATLIEFEEKIKINYQITDENQNLMCRAHTTQVAIKAENYEICSPTPIILIDKIKRVIG